MRASTKPENRNRIVTVFILLALVLLVLVGRLAWIQIINADFYTDKAIDQQTKDTAIEAKRGSILDRNGRELAISTTCYILWVRPSVVKSNNGIETPESKISEICTQLSDITGIKKEDIKKKIMANEAMVKIAGNLEKEQADQIRKLNLKGFQVDEGTRRYYPLGTLASQVLGSVTADNTGRTGIELKYDQYLSGISGRWVKNTDLHGNELVEGSAEYYEAQDGLNVVLTIDEAIQYYVEKAIEKGMEKTKAKRIMCLVMNPNTGEVLASAVTPGFDPNNPTVPIAESEQKKYEKMSVEEKNKYLFGLWRNPVVSDTYEPGSTFKLITASSALEERVISTSDTFSCNSRITISGVTLHCWSNRNHGVQTIREAIGNSCNPVHAKIASMMGKTVFYKYLDLFGITEKTGIDYPGESGSIVKKLDGLGPVDLATIGYGQGISVTPIQLLTAINAIGNDGLLIEPRYVKALVDKDGNVVESYETKVKRKVISSKTAAEMRSIMQYVVDEGGGGNARIAGYRVGGKTGTANKVEAGVGYGKNYYSSFVGMAPMDNPQVSILVVVDSPKGSYYGSMVAAPIAKDILEDTLRYLNIAPKYTEKEKKALESNYTKVPNVVGQEFSEAVGILAGKDLKYSRPKSARDSDSFTVVAQFPEAGTKVKKNSVVYVYKE